MMFQNPTFSDQKAHSNKSYALAAGLHSDRFLDGFCGARENFVGRQICDFFHEGDC